MKYVIWNTWYACWLCTYKSFVAVLCTKFFLKILSIWILQLSRKHLVKTSIFCIWFLAQRVTRAFLGFFTEMQLKMQFKLQLLGKEFYSCRWQHQSKKYRLLEPNDLWQKADIRPFPETVYVVTKRVLLIYFHVFQMIPFTVVFKQKIYILDSTLHVAS